MNPHAQLTFGLPFVNGERVSFATYRKVQAREMAVLVLMEAAREALALFDLADIVTSDPTQDLASLAASAEVVIETMGYDPAATRDRLRSALDQEALA